HGKRKLNFSNFRFGISAVACRSVKTSTSIEPAPPPTVSASEEPVVLRSSDARGVVTLTLNRPRAFNTLSEVTLTALQRELDAIAHNESVRVVVLAVASSTAKFAVSGVNLGLFCSAPGVALSRNVLRKGAFEMLVTGEFISADEAKARGLINRAAEPEQLDGELEKLVAAIVAKPRIA